MKKSNEAKMNINTETDDGTSAAESTSSAANDAPSEVDPTSVIRGFDLKSMIVSQDFTELAPGEKILTAIPLSRPKRHWFVRFNPSPEYRAIVYTIAFKQPEEMYMVTPGVAPLLASEVKPTLLQLGVTSQGMPFICPFRMAGPDSRDDQWAHSAHRYRAEGETSWIRVTANMVGGFYETIKALANLGDPVWPTAPLSELVHLAFRGNIIDSMEHPVVKTRILGSAR